MSKQVACPKHGIVDAPCYECAKEFATQFPRVVPSPADPIAAAAREMVEQYSLAGMRPWLSVPERRLLEREITAFGHRMKSADRAEASAWRPMREARDAMLDAIRVLDRARACEIDNNAEDRDEEGDPIASSITDADALHKIAEYTSIIERLKSALPTPPEGGER